MLTMRRKRMTKKEQRRHDFLRALRVANVVYDGLIASAAGRQLDVISGLRSVIETAREVDGPTRQLQIAHDRGWQVATATLIDDARRMLIYVTNQVAEANRKLDTCIQALPKIGDILAEIRQTEDEFDQPVQYDSKAKTLSLTTEPITLEDVFLGPFEIRLQLNELGKASGGHPYQVIAKEPNPASGSDHVTHPHVSSDALCEGDATAPIHSALAQGRLADFFCLVRGVLQTYNSGSAFIALADWDGTACHECGSICGSDNTFFCDQCERDFCDDCHGSCRACGTYMCLGCLSRCVTCGARLCESCSSSCDACGETVCSECLIECPKCGLDVCNRCMRTCIGCNQKLCPECIENDRCKECFAKQKQPPQIPQPEEPVSHEQQEQPEAASGAAAVERSAPAARRRRRSAAHAESATSGRARVGRTRRRRAA